MSRSMCVAAAGAVIAIALAARPWAPAVRAQAPSRPAPGDRPAMSGIQGVAPFAETFVRDALSRFEVAGAGLAVVEGDHVVSSAHGVADTATGARLNPATSRFHIASVTKLITAIAAMQLVEAGALDLDADVARYLEPALLPALGGRVIRARDLLTHTAGFADRWVGMAATSPEAVWPLATYLERRAAPIVDAPATVTRYSNYGYSLAGHLVERVSGMPFAEYVRARIFAPLGAVRSYVGPRAVDDDDVQGFFYRDAITAEPRVFEHTVPAGGVHATIADLARVVGTVLGDGSFDGARLLSPESARAIRRPQFTPDPELPGWGFGVYARGGWTDEAWMAGGEIPGFSTRVLLVPSRRLAVVIAVNRKDPSLALALFDAVMSRLPAESGSRATPVGPAPEGLATALAGRYRVTLGDPSSFLKFASIFVPSLTVTPLDERTMDVEFANVERPSEIWRLVSTGALLDPAGLTVAFAKRDDRGRPTHLLVSDQATGLVTFARVPWWDAPEPTLLVLLGALATSILTLVVMAGTTVRAGTAGTTGTAARRSLGAPGALVATLNVVFLVGFAIGLAQLAILRDDRFAFGVPLWFTGVLWLPVGLALAWMWLAARSWRARSARDGGVSTGARIWYAWLAAITLALLVVLWHWNLVGARL